MANQVIVASFENQRACRGPALGYADVEVYLHAETCRHVSIKSAQALEVALRQCGFAVRTTSLAYGARTVTVTAYAADVAAFRALKAQVAQLVRAHLGIACLVPESSYTVH